jgi:hypothetical protein
MGWASMYKTSFSPTTSIVLKQLYGQTSNAQDLSLYSASLATFLPLTGSVSAMPNLCSYMADHLVVNEILYHVIHLHEARKCAPGDPSQPTNMVTLQLLMKLHCLEI